MFGDYEFGDTLYGGGGTTAIDTMAAFCLSSPISTSILNELVTFHVSSYHKNIANVSINKSIFAYFYGISKSICSLSLVSLIYAYVAAINFNKATVGNITKSISYLISAVTILLSSIVFNKSDSFDVYASNRTLSYIFPNKTIDIAGNVFNQIRGSVSDIIERTSIYIHAISETIVSLLIGQQSNFGIFAINQSKGIFIPNLYISLSFNAKTISTALIETSKSAVAGLYNLSSTKSYLRFKATKDVYLNSVNKTIAYCFLAPKGLLREIERFIVNIGPRVSSSIVNSKLFTVLGIQKPISVEQVELNKIFIGEIDNQKISEEPGKSY